MDTTELKQRVFDPPTGYDPAIARWVWAIEDSRARTKHLLAGLTDEAVNWLPPAGGHNIGTLLYHLVAIELAYLYEDILAVGWVEELEPLLIYEVRDRDSRLTIVPGESLATHLTRLEAGRALLLKALRTMTPAEFQRSRRVEDYETTPEWVLHHLMQHEAEHRSQIGALRGQAEQSLGQAG